MMMMLLRRKTRAHLSSGDIVGICVVRFVLEGRAQILVQGQKIAVRLTFLTGQIREKASPFQVQLRVSNLLIIVETKCASAGTEML